MGDPLKMIIDASNIAHHQNKAIMKRIIEAIKAVKKLGFKPIVVADASLKHKIDDEEKYKEYIKRGVIKEVPAGTNADHYILKLAEEEDAKILSNDNFREFRDEFKNIDSRRVPYTFENNKIVIGKIPKVRKVKDIIKEITLDALNKFKDKGFDYYNVRHGKKLSGIAVAKEAISRIKVYEEGLESKVEEVFMKIPVLKNVLEMVENIEEGNYIIFVLVNPQDYKKVVKYAGNIAVTVRDNLELEYSPLVAVRNDIFMRKNHFELNVLPSEDVMEESPYNVNITVNNHDYALVKRNSRNIASTIAARIGSWRFPIVAVRPSVLLENPGEFEVTLEKGGQK